VQQLQKQNKTKQNKTKHLEKVFGKSHGRALAPFHQASCGMAQPVHVSRF
jgi:hypothetical protein